MHVETKLTIRQVESVTEVNPVSEDAKSKDEPTEEKTRKEKNKRRLYDYIIQGFIRLSMYQLKEGSLNPWDELTNNGNTVLHVAVGCSIWNHDLLKRLLEMTPKEKLLDRKNSDGSSLLHVAAIGGHIEAVNILVERNPELLLAKDKEGHTPLALSVSNMHIKTSHCLFDHMKVHGYGNLFSGQSGEDLVVLAISCQDFRGVFVVVVPLVAIMAIMFHGFLKVLVRPFIEDTSQIHEDATYLLSDVCNKILGKSDSSTYQKYYTSSIFEATRRNASTFIIVVMKRFPDAIWSTNEDSHNFIQYSVISRSEKIYNLLYEMSEHKNIYKTIKDSSANNLLHLAARLAPTNN